MLTQPAEKLDGLRTYIDGKMRRYTLLFAVNGGAFAIARMMSENPARAVGELTALRLAIGAMAFTIILTADIWLWGEMMRTRFVSDVFTHLGKTILVLLALLLILAWGLAVPSWTATGFGAAALAAVIAMLALRGR